MASKANKSQPFRISAKNLGELALPGFCPRCFWLGLHFDLPFQGGFPGIFSSIDSYTKKVVHEAFDSGQGCPPWLAGIGAVKGYIHPPSPQKFFTDDPETGVRLTGSADGILILEDGNRAIIDYKTARYTETQDVLRPVYNVQLNGYAHIADAIGLGPVTKLALVYTEPLTIGTPDLFASNRTHEGFRLGFQARIVDVELKPGLLPPLLKEAARIHALPKPPDGNRGCGDCRSFDALAVEREKWLRP